MRRGRTAIAVFALGGLAAAAGVAGADKSAQRGDGARSHRVHAAIGAACTACHDAADVSVQAAACRACHQVDDPRLRQVGRGGNSRIVRYPHRAHRSRPCAGCHGAAGGFSGTMADCLSCHQATRSACAACHPPAADERISVASRLPPDVLGMAHTGDWRQAGHAAAARMDATRCTACHTQAQCADCHQRWKLPPLRLHPPGWQAEHGVAAAADPSGCAACHRGQGTCLTCHRRTGVAADAPQGRRSTSGKDFHRGEPPEVICAQARVRIESCVSCHSESSCVRCHVRYNPHPPGFSRTCRRARARSAGMCARCHSDVDAVCP